MKESIQSIINSATKFCELAKPGIYKEELKAMGIEADLTYSSMVSLRYKESLTITISTYIGASLSISKPLEMDIKSLRKTAKDLEKKVKAFEELIPTLASIKRAERLAQLEKEKEALELEISKEKELNETSHA